MQRLGRTVRSVDSHTFICFTGIEDDRIGHARPLRRLSRLSGELVFHLIRFPSGRSDISQHLAADFNRLLF